MKTTTIRLPNGEEVQIRTDDPKAAAAAARKIWQSRGGASLPKPPPGKRTGWQTAGDFLGDVVDNVLPNFGDEIAAIPDAAKAAVKGQPIGEAYDRGRREFRQHQDQYDKEHPALAWGSTLTGLGASLALPAGRVASGAGMAAKVLHGAAVGAGYGALAGAGEGDSLSDRATNAAKGLVGGAALGGIMSPAAAGAARLARNARQAIPGVDDAVRRLANVPRGVMRRPLRTAENARREDAARFMSNRMDQGHVSAGFGQQGAPSSPRTLMDEVLRRQAMNVPAVLGDVSEPMRATTSWASRGMGPGQTMVRESLNARKAQEAGRVRQHIIDTMGDVSPDPVQEVQEYSSRARREAAPMYAEAYAQPMVLTPEIRGIVRTPAFQDAIPNAVRNIRNAQREPEAMGFVMREDGTLDPQAYQYLSTEAFDHVVRAMRDNAESRMAPPTFPGGRPTNTTDSVHINARAGDLRNELAAQNGAYRDVQAMYADEMGMRDAFQNGQDLVKLNGPFIDAQARRAPQANARDAWSLGARTAMANEATEYGARYRTGDTAGRVRQMLGDDAKQDAMQDMMHGRPNAVAGLQERLEAEQQGHVLWNEVHGNSRTADRQQLDTDLDAAAGSLPSIPLTPSGIIAKAVNRVQAGANQQRRQALKDHVGRTMVERDPARLRAIIDEIEGVRRRDREFADGLHDFSLFGTKAGAVNIRPASPDMVEDEPDYGY